MALPRAEPPAPPPHGAYGPGEQPRRSSTDRPGPAAGRSPGRGSGSRSAPSSGQRGTGAPGRRDGPRTIGAHLLSQSDRRHNLRAKVRAETAMTGGREGGGGGDGEPRPAEPPLRGWQPPAPAPGRAPSPAPREWRAAGGGLGGGGLGGSREETVRGWAVSRSGLRTAKGRGTGVFFPKKVNAFKTCEFSLQDECFKVVNEPWGSPFLHV